MSEKTEHSFIGGMREKLEDGVKTLVMLGVAMLGIAAFI